MKISVFDTSSEIRIHRKTAQQIVRGIIKIEGEKCACKNMNIIITDNKHLKELNMMFLHRKRSTNVLAFDLEDTCEIYVNYQAARSAYDIYYFIAHGLLHLIGYEHDTVATRRQMDHRCVSYLDRILGKGNHPESTFADADA